MAVADRGAPWRTGVQPDRSLARGLLAAPVEDVARALLGVRLISTVGGVVAVGVVVETEAYQGPDDPASHAATRHGRTARNATMFGPSGRAYVYRSYGVHWCLNVVTGAEGDPQAVLVRGLESLEGEDAMLDRRGGRRPLAAGPGRLCQALGVTGDLDGHDLRHPPLVLAGGWAVEDGRVGISGRVGVRKAADRPLRFYVRGSPGVTRVSGVHPFSRTDRA
ncbi:MAG: DNA-3-methyladenine glycosylase [Gemmatimonadota bacterium]